MHENVKTAVKECSSNIKRINGGIFLTEVPFDDCSLNILSVGTQMLPINQKEYAESFGIKEWLDDDTDDFNYEDIIVVPYPVRYCFMLPSLWASTSDFSRVVIFNLIGGNYGTPVLSEDDVDNFVVQLEEFIEKYGIDCKFIVTTSQQG